MYISDLLFNLLYILQKCQFELYSIKIYTNFEFLSFYNLLLYAYCNDYSIYCKWINFAILTFYIIFNAKSSHFPVSFHFQAILSQWAKSCLPPACWHSALIFADRNLFRCPLNYYAQFLRYFFFLRAVWRLFLYSNIAWASFVRLIIKADELSKSEWSFSEWKNSTRWKKGCVLHYFIYKLK